MNPIFAVPVDEKILIYSPLQKISALVNRTAASMIRDSVLLNQEPHEKVNALCRALKSKPFEKPEPRTGSLSDPRFLGLVPAYSRLTGCIFTDCTMEVGPGPVMSMETARRALDAYFELLIRTGQSLADIRIFGGEDFPALDILFFTEAYTKQRASQLNLGVRLTLITDGRLSPKIARWVGDHLDDVMLCMDRLEMLEDHVMRGSFEPSISPQVLDNAVIISESAANLTLRVCITSQIIPLMSDIAECVVNNLIPEKVCFQTWFPPCGSDELNPVRFAREFNQAANVLEACGILALHHPADIRTPRISPCAVGKDALIISSDGRLNACPLPSSVWESKSLPFQIGALHQHSFKIDPIALNDTRALTVLKAPICEDCISLFHCAGGCYVHNPREQDPQRFSDRCLQTRLVTICNLLRAMDQYEAARDWLSQYHPDSQEHRVVQDRLKDLK